MNFVVWFLSWVIVFFVGAMLTVGFFISILTDRNGKKGKRKKRRLWKIKY